VKIALSADGLTFAKANYYDQDNHNGQNAGVASIYTLDSSSSSWVQRGTDIHGAPGDMLGVTISLSADGQTVSIGNFGISNAGQVRIFTWGSSDWVQLGAGIDGEAANDRASTGTLSEDGRTVAISSQGNDGVAGVDTGHVRVFIWEASNWVQLGTDIDGEAAHDYSGHAGLSADGRTVAIGAYANDGAGDHAGHVRVYTYDESNWVQLGGDIDGEAAHDESGAFGAELSADGRTVAIGARSNDGGGPNSGHVRIYSWDSSSWVQVGADINGEARDDWSGWSISLTSDGQTVAIGAIANDGGGDNAGHVRVFTWDSSSWVQVGADIDGSGAGQQMSIYNSVALSGNGQTMATSSGYKADAGTATIYHLN